MMIRMDAVKDEIRGGAQDATSDNEEEEQSKKPIHLCEICGENEGKYKCPKCGCRTCCLACVKVHKAKSGCDGIKPKQNCHDVKVRPVEMNTDFLRRDVDFISDGIDTINKLRKRKANY